MYAIHPHEFDQHFEDIEYADFYYVELDPSFDSWVNAEQEKLKFVVRENEQEQFEQFKIEYNMKPISLTALLGDEQEFLEEYNRVCAVIGIDPIPEQALILRQDWRSMRFN
jgi:hypothetical protein